MTPPSTGIAKAADKPFAQALLKPAVRPRPLPLLGSAGLHAAALFLLLHVPVANPRAFRVEDYRVLPPPRDRKLIWYKLDTRMPDVSIGRKYGQRPPRARLRSKDLAIHASMPDAPARDQLIFQPAAAAEIPKSVPSLNMAAFQPAHPPEPPLQPKPEPPKPEVPPVSVPAPRRAVRAFKPPPAPAPSKPRPIELTEAPIDAVPDTAALGQLTAVVVGVKPMPGAPPALPEGIRPANVSVGPAAGNGPGGALNPSPASGIELIASGGGSGAGMSGKPVFASQTILFTRSEIEQRRGAVAVPVRLAMVPELAQKHFGNRTVYLTFLEKPNPQHYTGDILLWFAERGQTAAGGQAMHAPVPFRQMDPFGPRSRSPRRIRGTIRLAAIIGADGFLSDLRVLDSPDDALDSPLLEAAAKWTFLPALRGPARIAVDALFEIPVAFAPASPGGTTPAAAR